MKVNLHIVYNNHVNGMPVVLTDEKYEDFKETFEICEKQGTLYYKSGHFAGLVHHTDIEVDEESVYNEAYLDGLLAPEDEGASIQEYLSDRPKLLEYFKNHYNKDSG